MDQQPDSNPKRYWFSPSPFIRKMEAFSVAPLTLSLASSLAASVFFARERILPPTIYGRLEDAIACLAFAVLSLIFFAFANIFAIVAFFQLDYSDSPKGLAPKILYRLAAAFAVIWIFLLTQIR